MVTDEMVEKSADEMARQDITFANCDRKWQLRTIRRALEAALSAAEPMGVLCTGCGSSWDDDRLAEEKAKRPELLSCCPERKLEPVWYQNIKGMLSGVSFTEEMKMACLREFESFYKSALSAQVQDVAETEADIVERMVKSVRDPFPTVNLSISRGIDGWRELMRDALRAAAPAKQEGGHD